MRTLLIALVCLLTACGGDRQDSLPPTSEDTSSAILDSLSEADTVSVDDYETPEERNVPSDRGDATPDPPVTSPETDGGGGQPGDRAPSTGDPARTPGTPSRSPGPQQPTSSTDDSRQPELPATYRLVSIDGERVPVTLDENPDCRVELMSGSIRIRSDLSFDLEARNRTLCGGEDQGDEVRTAEGTVTRDASDLRFEASSGELFATALGTLTSAGDINVTHLELEGEPLPVDWKFER